MKLVRVRRVPGWASSTVRSQNPLSGIGQDWAVEGGLLTQKDDLEYVLYVLSHPSVDNYSLSA